MLFSVVSGKSRSDWLDTSNRIKAHKYNHGIICLRWTSFCLLSSMGLLPDTSNCGLCMRRECREHFPRHRGLAIPTCITACDAYQDRLLTVSFEVGCGENVPGIPGACATRNFTCMVRGPLSAWCVVAWHQYHRALKYPSLNPFQLCVSESFHWSLCTVGHRTTLMRVRRRAYTCTNQAIEWWLWQAEILR